MANLLEQEKSREIGKQGHKHFLILEIGFNSHPKLKPQIHYIGFEPGICVWTSGGKSATNIAWLQKLVAFLCTLQENSPVPVILSESDFTKAHADYNWILSHYYSHITNMSAAYYK